MAKRPLKIFALNFWKEFNTPPFKNTLKTLETKKKEDKKSTHPELMAIMHTEEEL